MAIEITPKKEVKKISWTNILLIFCLVYFLVLFSSYFILGMSEKKLLQQISQLETSLVKTPEQELLEKEVFAYQKKIDDFAFLLSNHRFVSNVFTFLEKVTHPMVWFSKFDLDAEKGLVSLKGEAENFEVLGQFMLTLRNESLIEDINLTDVSMTKQGKVEFDLKLNFKPEIFKTFE